MNHFYYQKSHIYSFQHFFLHRNLFNLFYHFIVKMIVVMKILFNIHLNSFIIISFKVIHGNFIFLLMGIYYYMEIFFLILN
jgi:hypothetical protein